MYLTTSRRACSRVGYWVRWSLVVIACRPADHFFRVAVNDRRQVQPALPCRNAGDVADHFPAGRVSGEVPFHEVGNVMLPAVALGQAEPPRARLARAPGPARASLTAPAPARPVRPGP